MKILQFGVSEKHVLIPFLILGDTGHAGPPFRSPGGRLAEEGACRAMPALSPEDTPSFDSVSPGAFHKIETEKQRFCRAGRTGLSV